MYVHLLFLTCLLFLRCCIVETEAIVPPATPFLLTTDSNLFSNASEASVTTVASDRYFDRPDVLKAYREQLTIQTPSYRNVKDNLVVARFRPRGPEDVSPPDTFGPRQSSIPSI